MPQDLILRHFLVLAEGLGFEPRARFRARFSKPLD